MPRGSKKPCPGCNKVDPWRPASEVCSECKRALKRAAYLEEQLSKIEADEVMVTYGARAHWNSYIRTRSGKAGRELMGLFFNLAEAVSKPSTAHWTKSEFDLLGPPGSRGATRHVTMPRSVAVAIRNLRLAVVRALELEYEAGKDHGHKLLLRLAEGDISMNEFDQRTSE